MNGRKDNTDQTIEEKDNRNDQRTVNFLNEETVRICKNTEGREACKNADRKPTQDHNLMHSNNIKGEQTF